MDCLRASSFFAISSVSVVSVRCRAGDNKSLPRSVNLGEHLNSVVAVNVVGMYTQENGGCRITDVSSIRNCFGNLESLEDKFTTVATSPFMFLAVKANSLYSEERLVVREASANGTVTSTDVF